GIQQPRSARHGGLSRSRAGLPGASLSRGERSRAAWFYAAKRSCAIADRRAATSSSHRSPGIVAQLPVTALDRTPPASTIVANRFERTLAIGMVSRALRTLY